MRRWILPLLAVLIVALLAGCSGAPAEEGTDPTGWKPEPNRPRDLTSLISAQEVSEAVGTAVETGVMQEGGEILSFSSADYSVQVSLLLEEEPAGGAEAYLNAVAAGYGEGALIPALNLGEEAYWCERTGELLARDGGRVLSVNLAAENMDGERRLLAARQIALLALERLK